VRAAVLTVSDGVSAGEREDASGDLLADALTADGWEVERRTVADDRAEIVAAVRELAGANGLVLTTGGTPTPWRGRHTECSRAGRQGSSARQSS
jgi:molybdopterin biosynthesis enzyme MoaB